MNKAIIVGNITKDLELKVANDKYVLEFSLAVNENKDTVDYIDCVAWEKNAENIAQYCTKGTKLLVEGRIKTQSWDDATTGQKRYRTKIRVDRIEFISKATSNSTQATTSYNKPKTAPSVQATPVNNAPNEWQAPANQQMNLTGTSNDVTGHIDEAQPNGQVIIDTDDLPFY